jgi:hypothetical protein
MPNMDYIPTDDEGKAALFERFRDAIGTYSADLALAPAEVTAQADDTNWFRYVLNHSISMRDSGSQWTSYKNLLLTGTDNAAATPVTPPPPVPSPPATFPGVLNRFRALARRIKTNAAYTEATGEALGIVGPESTGPDLATITPEISLRTIGDQIEILWKKQGMEAIEIQKDTGSGWQLLALDTRPNYIDTTPFPTPAATWKYRAIYCEDSQKVGQWSNVAEITVGG